MKVLLNGASGKMGGEVLKAIEQQPEFEVFCGFDCIESTDKGFPVYSDINKIKEEVDVIIDFSVPVATFKILEYAEKTNTPIVIATTGFTQEEINKIEEISKKIPVFRSSNMAFDINLMASLVQEIAKVLTNTDIEIVETHHNRKVDSPSGTAILLANAINDVLENKKTYNFERMQKREPRSKNEIGFSSIRGGNIVGEHSVKFFGENETLELKHTAYSRQVFAEGALKAAKFLVNQKPGLYDMKNLV